MVHTGTDGLVPTYDRTRLTSDAHAITGLTQLWVQCMVLSDGSIMLIVFLPLEFESDAVSQVKIWVMVRHFTAVLEESEVLMLQQFCSSFT